jgi:predicted secreted Zn-dependent protease
MKQHVLALFCCLTWGAAQAADPVDPFPIEFYTITGNTAAEMRASLGKLGPVGKDGKTYHARTNWNVKWRYTVNAKGTRCTVNTTTVTVRIGMYMPRWDKRSEVPRKLQDKWDKYYVSLRLHENGHMNHGVAAADEIKRMLFQRSSNQSCAALKEEIRSAADAIIADYIKKDATHDASTNHGRRQGAEF